MTKEELKQEAEESFEQYKVTDEDYVVSPYSDDMGEKMLMYNDEYYAEETYLRFYTEGYLAGAEPREKRIEELEAENEQIKNSDTLCKLIGEHKRKIAELEAQIEKMKNCRNCKNEKIEGACGHFTQVGWCRDWELAD